MKIKLRDAVKKTKLRDVVKNYEVKEQEFEYGDTKGIAELLGWQREGWK